MPVMGGRPREPRPGDVARTTAIERGHRSARAGNVSPGVRSPPAVAVATGPTNVAIIGTRERS